jgi:hypothetical protein
MEVTGAYTRARKAIYEALHPETKHGAAGRLPANARLLTIHCGRDFVQFDKLGMKIVQFDDVCRNALDPKLAKSRQSMSAREKPVAAIPLGNRDRMLQANGLNRVP